MSKPRVSNPQLLAAPSWWTGGLIGLFAVSLGWKLFCLNRLQSSPLYGDFSADSKIYWSWAQILIQDGWVGRSPFFLGPLYPYLLALLRPSPGSYWAPLMVQCVLGSVAVVLVARAARLVCAPRYSIIAGALTAGYAMATFMDLSILSESVLWFLAATFLYLQLSATRRMPRFFHVTSGLLIGLMSLGRPSCFLLTAPHLVSAISGRGMRRGLQGAAIASACALGVCLPVLMRHVSLGHGWILTTYSFGYNVYIGNGPHATGAYVSLIDDAGVDESATGATEGGVDGDGRAYIYRKYGLKLSPLESSAYWLQQTSAQLSASPARVIRLLVWKSALSLNHAEVYQLDNIHVHERIDGPLGLMAIGEFGWIGALGLFGLVIARRTTQGRVLIAHALAMWAPMVIFFVTDRYRYHLVLPLLVACGPALELAWGLLRLRTGFTVQLAPALLTLVATAAVVWLPLVQFDRQQIEFEVHHKLGDAFLSKGDYAQAEVELQKCLEPGTLSGVPLRRSSAARSAVSSVLHSLGTSYASRGLYLQSERALRLAVSYSPGVRNLRRDHAVVLAMSGMHDKALAELDTLKAPAGLLERELLRVAERAVRAESWGPAEQALRAAIVVDSTSEAANVILLRILHAQGRDGEADLLLRRLSGRLIPAEVIRRETAAMQRH